MNISEYRDLVQKTLEEYFEDYKKTALYDKTIWDAMSYTCLLAGKKLRAVFCLETCRMFSGSFKSLIHDDLPCMDNDDLRRGKPSNHKVFGEAMAVLAGDALISLGAQIIIDKTPKTLNSTALMEVLRLYLKSAGAFGIVAGQCADMEAEKKLGKINEEHLKYIHTYKTAALFECSIVSGALLAGVSCDMVELMSDFALNFGLTFQAYDDILDVISTTDELGKTAGKDEKSQKATYVSLFGLEIAKEKFNELILNCHDILKKAGIESEVFKGILDKMHERVNK